MSKELEKMLRDAEKLVITNLDEVRETLEAFWALTVADLRGPAANTENIDRILEILQAEYLRTDRPVEHITMRDLTSMLAAADQDEAFRCYENTKEGEPHPEASSLGMMFARQLIHSEKEYAVMRLLKISVSQLIQFFNLSNAAWQFGDAEALETDSENPELQKIINRDPVRGLRKRIMDCMQLPEGNLPLNMPLKAVLVKVNREATRPYTPGFQGHEEYIQGVQKCCDTLYDLLVRYPGRFLEQQEGFDPEAMLGKYMWQPGDEGWEEN